MPNFGRTKAADLSKNRLICWIWRQYSIRADDEIDQKCDEYRYLNDPEDKSDDRMNLGSRRWLLLVLAQSDDSED